MFLDCDTSDFERCLFHQSQDDDLDFDGNGALYERGMARIVSMPTHQWGKRCLLIYVEASTSVTISV